jgi:lysyl-tRNA synthetase class 2
MAQQIGQSLQQIREFRINKLNQLKVLGFDPYTANVTKSKSNSELKSNYETLQGQKFFVAGRVLSIRSYGKLLFLDVADETDKIQCICMPNNVSSISDQNAYKYFSFDQIGEFLDSGDFVEVYGELMTSKTGEISINTVNIRIITKALRPIPEELSNIEERYRQRYVDMQVNPAVKKVIETRSKVTQEIRNFLLEKDFVEVETPTLQPIYGGASARPFVTHHNSLDSDFYLRISNELYLKRMIVAGFERVFEFARDFRNEGMDRSHNPEFTMLEFYAAYLDYNDLMDMTQDMVQRCIRLTNNDSLMLEYQGQTLNFSNIRRVTFRDIIFETTGFDIATASLEDVKSEIQRRNLDIDLSLPKKDLLDEFYKETTRKNVVQPIFLMDYPYEMIPLAKRKFENPEYIASFQLVCCGFELVKAYNELNDPIDQYDRMAEDQSNQEAGLTEEAMMVDNDFIRALEYGMPPTAGWGMGIDRFVTFLTNQDSIKDTIAFPTLRPEEYGRE